LGALQNCLLTLGACRGKYIAFCEGDDFWIEPQKLAKQVDVLEKDSSLAGCFHDCYCLNQRTGRKTLFVGNRKIDPRPDTASIIREKHVPSLSMVFRNCISLSDLAHLARGLIQTDHVLWLLVSEHGPLQYLAEPMAVYRVHDGGIWSSLSALEARRQELRFTYALIASNRYPALREVILAVRRNMHRRLGIALANENHFLKSLYHYGRSIGPNDTLQDTQVRSSEYWLTLVRRVSRRVGLHAPLAWLRKRFARPRANL
jgi:hypothetical protein